MRDRHLAHLDALDAEGRVVWAGPLRDERGSPCGSVVVIEADDLASARAVAEGDPYRTEGVFERVDVHETTTVFPRARD